MKDIKIRVSEQDNTDFLEANPYICQVISGKASKKLANEVHKRLANLGRASMYPPVRVEDEDDLEDIDDQTQCVVLILDANTRSMVKTIVKKSKSHFEILAVTQILEYAQNPPLGLPVHNLSNTNFERGFTELRTFRT